MPIEAKLLPITLVLMLLVCPSLGRAQTPKVTLEDYISQSVGESEGVSGATVAEWTVRHRGERVESREDRGSDDDPRNDFKLSAREQQDRKLQGRWCLQSRAEVELAGGILVHRTALFYQPLVEQTFGKPLPLLPTETGDALQKQGCRLVRVLHEFEGISDPRNVVETIAKKIPGKRVDEPGKFIEYSRDSYWSPICSFEKFGQPISYHHLFTRNSKVANTDDPVAVLLEWEWGTSEYGNPTSKTIDPEAVQPWLAARAAMRAQLAERSTLEMLSFLAPQVGDTYEQRPLHCERQLIPVLRQWFDLAAKSAPEQHAAALLLADRVLGRLWYCEEFLHSGPYDSPEEEAVANKDNEALEQDLQELGIRTATTRLAEFYSGNLLDDVLKLAPEGAVNELGRMAILDDRCHWDYNSDSADCAKIIREGESFLSHFPEDEWTPSVHLILAEAYSLTAANAEDNSATPGPTKTELEKKAAAHYRAWYAKSANERDRALVWQEIWALDAGMGPWLMAPDQLRH